MEYVKCNIVIIVTLRFLLVCVPSVAVLAEISLNGNTMQISPSPLLKSHNQSMLVLHFQTICLPSVAVLAEISLNGTMQISPSPPPKSHNQSC